MSTSTSTPMSRTCSRNANRPQRRAEPSARQRAEDPRQPRMNAPDRDNRPDDDRRDARRPAVVELEQNAVDASDRPLAAIDEKRIEETAHEFQGTLGHH